MMSANPADQRINRPIFRLNTLITLKTRKTHEKEQIKIRIEILLKFCTANEWIKCTLPMANQ